MRIRSVGALFGCAVLAGLAFAAAALPVSAVLGLSAKAAADSYLELPNQLSTPPPAQATLVYANDAKTLITTFYEQNRRDVAIDDVATVMQQAIVAAEDTRFYSHGGVDLRGVLRALVSDAHSGEAAQGASTLTMQYVRNVLQSDPDLTPQEREAATADTPARKLREIRYAVELERTMSKQDILERYLNIAYFGHGAYGISAAAQAYFGKQASQLTLAEAALLAGMVQSPDANDPIGGDDGPALDRRSYVLDAMAKMGAITADQASAAKAAPIGLNPQRQPNDCASVAPEHNDWGFFCDYFRQWWDAQPQFGSTVAERDLALRTGGYTVVTSLDPGVQAAALAQSLKVYPYGTARALPIAVVTPGTGRVQALAVNRHYSLDANPPEHPKYPNTVNQLVAGGGSVTGYQSGSTFKLFTMLAALEAGKTLDTVFDAPSPLVTPYPGTPGTCGGRWCPVNNSPEWMDGPRTMWTGFGRSVNTYFVWLEEQIGPPAAVAMAQRLGIQFRAAERRQAGRQPGHLGRLHPRRGRHDPARPRQRVRDDRQQGCLLCTVAGRVHQGRHRQRRAGRQPDLPPGRLAGHRRGRGRRGPVPGRRAVQLRHLRRRYGHHGRRHPRRPAGRRQDRQRGAERDRDVRRLHPAGRGGRHRHQPGRPPRRGRLRRLGGGGHRGRPYHRRRRGGPAGDPVPGAEPGDRHGHPPQRGLDPGAGEPDPVAVPGAGRARHHRDQAAEAEAGAVPVPHPAASRIASARDLRSGLVRVAPAVRGSGIAPGAAVGGGPVADPGRAG